MRNTSLIILQSLSTFSGLFFVEGIEWGNRFENVAQFPINTGMQHPPEEGNVVHFLKLSGNSALNNRVVYSPHCYGPSVYDRPEFNVNSFYIYLKHTK